MILDVYQDDDYDIAEAEGLAVRVDYASPEAPIEYKIDDVPYDGWTATPWRTADVNYRLDIHQVYHKVYSWLEGQ